MQKMVHADKTLPLLRQAATQSEGRTGLQRFQKPVYVLFMCNYGGNAQIFAEDFIQALGASGVDNELTSKLHEFTIQTPEHPTQEEQLVKRRVLAGNVVVDSAGSIYSKFQAPSDTVRKQYMTVHNTDGTPILDEQRTPRAYDYVVILIGPEVLSRYRDSAKTMPGAKPTVFQIGEVVKRSGGEERAQDIMPLVRRITASENRRGNKLEGQAK